MYYLTYLIIIHILQLIAQVGERICGNCRLLHLFLINWMNNKLDFFLFFSNVFKDSYVFTADY